jgi:hypothetical protein
MSKKLVWKKEPHWDVWLALFPSHPGLYLRLMQETKTGDKWSISFIATSGSEYKACAVFSASGLKEAKEKSLGEMQCKILKSIGYLETVTEVLESATLPKKEQDLQKRSCKTKKNQSKPKPNQMPCR